MRENDNISVHMRQSGKKAPLPIAASIAFRESNQLCLSADAVSASLESEGPRAWQSVLPDPMVAGNREKCADRPASGLPDIARLPRLAGRRPGQIQGRVLQGFPVCEHSAAVRKLDSGLNVCPGKEAQVPNRGKGSFPKAGLD